MHSKHSDSILSIPRVFQ